MLGLIDQHRVLQGNMQYVPKQCTVEDGQTIQEHKFQSCQNLQNSNHQHLFIYTPYHTNRSPTIGRLSMYGNPTLLTKKSYTIKKVFRYCVRCSVGFIIYEIPYPMNKAARGNVYMRNRSILISINY